MSSRGELGESVGVKKVQFWPAFEELGAPRWRHSSAPDDGVPAGAKNYVSVFGEHEHAVDTRDGGQVGGRPPGHGIDGGSGAEPRHEIDLTADDQHESELVDIAGVVE